MSLFNIEGEERLITVLKVTPGSHKKRIITIEITLSSVQLLKSHRIIISENFALVSNCYNRQIETPFFPLLVYWMVVQNQYHFFNCAHEQQALVLVTLLYYIRCYNIKNKISCKYFFCNASCNYLMQNYQFQVLHHCNWILHKASLDTFIRTVICFSGVWHMFSVKVSITLITILLWKITFLWNAEIIRERECRAPRIPLNGTPHNCGWEICINCWYWKCSHIYVVWLWTQDH